jgi:hypothetical protein
MAIPDAWSETAFVSISIVDGAWQTFQTLTETIDANIGEKNVEWIPDMAGGRIAKFMPQEETSITLEAYPIDVGTATTAAGTGTGFYDLMFANTTTTQPQTISGTRDRLKIKIVLLWTSLGATTAATEIQEVTVGNAALRMQFAEGYVTSVKPSFTDGLLKFTIEAKFPAFNKSGGTTHTFESINITSGGSPSTMSAVGAYT